jgi:hypothetical protein
MALCDVTPFEDLGDDLDRSLLHVFVAGPGQGEGIVVALPGAGWLVVDGCRTNASRRHQFPLEEVFKKFKRDDDRIELAIITHPHSDHIEGFSELLDDHDPLRVGVTGLAHPGRTIADEAERIAEKIRSEKGANPRRNRVLATLKAIHTWAGDDEERLVPLHGGAALELNEASLHLTACSPDAAILKAWQEEGQWLQHLSKSPNPLSLVLELVWNDTRLVFGGDLPVSERGRPVETGWELVLETFPRLIDHVGFKVPHHGSRDALHHRLMKPSSGAADRAWLLTPYNSSNLPRSDEHDGLDLLLDAQSPVMLTAPAVSKRFLAAVESGRVTPSSLADLTTKFSQGKQWAQDDTLIQPSTAKGPLDPVWCVAFDDKGAVVGRWRGSAALDIWREP